MSPRLLRETRPTNGVTVKVIAPSEQRTKAARMVSTIRRIFVAILGLGRRAPDRPFATAREPVAPVPAFRGPIGSDRTCQWCSRGHSTSVVAAWLVAISGSRRGDAFQLEFDYTVVGSGVRDDLRIDVAGVAEGHLRIMQTSDGFVLYNGSESLETFVDGQRVAGTTQLEDGQIISVAGALLAFKYVVDGAEHVFPKTTTSNHELQQRLYRQEKRRRRLAHEAQQRAKDELERWRRTAGANDMSPPRYVCPCCGHLVLAAPSPGSWLTCPICRWLDEGGTEPGNLQRLFIAQGSYLRTGSSSPDVAGYTRPPLADERKADAWQLLPGVPEGPSPKERERERVEAAVLAAFVDVPPKGRVSLGQAYQADHFHRAETDWDDRDTNWRQLPDEVLTYFASRTDVFALGNVASFRYYLPAYILRDLRAGSSLIAPDALNLRPLRNTPFLDQEEVRILDTAQRAAVVLFLQYVVTFLGPDAHAENALTHIWLPSLEL